MHFPGRRSEPESLRAQASSGRLCHEHSSHRVRRTGTCSGPEPLGERALRRASHRSRQSRHRAARHQCGARRGGSSRGDRFLPGDGDRLRGGRAGSAPRRRPRRRSEGGRHQGLRTEQGGGAARRLEGLHQGSLRRVRHPHRRLPPLHRCGGGQDLCAQLRRADRREGGRSCRRQGRGGRHILRGGGERHRHDDRRRPRARPAPRW